MLKDLVHPRKLLDQRPLCLFDCITVQNDCLSVQLSLRISLRERNRSPEDHCTILWHSR